MKSIVRVILVSGILLAGCGGEQPKQEPKPEPSGTQEQKETPVEKPVETSPPPSSGEEMKEKPKAPSGDMAKPAVQRNATIVGDVIDIVSYSTTGVMGNSPAGKEIIEAGAKGGNPLGIWERKTGQVYLVTMKQANTSANSALLPFVGTPVTVKGDVYRRGDQRLLIISVIGKSPD